MIQLGSFELLSILDPDHHYSAALEKCGYSRTLTYYILLLLTLDSRESFVPLSLLRNYFNDTSQIIARQQLEICGLASFGREGSRGPTQIYLNKVILAPVYANRGRGIDILSDRDLRYLSIMRGLEEEQRARRLANEQINHTTPLPRTWCRAYLADLLYRSLAQEDKLLGQPTQGQHMSRITQWRARKNLARVGRIRREWKPSGHPRSPGKTLEINLERIPTAQSLAKPHPLDIPPHHRFHLRPTTINRS